MDTEKTDLLEQMRSMDQKVKDYEKKLNNLLVA
jgi:hypothetical protein